MFHLIRNSWTSGGLLLSDRGFIIECKFFFYQQTDKLVTMGAAKWGMEWGWDKQRGALANLSEYDL